MSDYERTERLLNVGMGSLPVFDGYVEGLGQGQRIWTDGILSFSRRHHEESLLSEELSGTRRVALQSLVLFMKHAESRICTSNEMEA